MSNSLGVAVNHVDSADVILFSPPFFLYLEHFFFFLARSHVSHEVILCGAAHTALDRLEAFPLQATGSCLLPRCS